MAFHLLRMRWVNPDGRNCSSRAVLETPVSLTNAELIAIAEAAQVEWNTHVATLYCADVVWRKWSCQTVERIVTPKGPAFSPLSQEQVGATAPVSGAVAGTSTPPQIAYVVSFKAAQPGRRRQGRMYTPTPPELFVDGTGAVSDSADRIAAVQQTIEAAEGAIAPVDVDHVIYSLTYGTQAEVTSYTGNNQADTQRRRAGRT